MATKPWLRELPADRLKELTANMLTMNQLASGHYRQLTGNINVFCEWGCLQRIAGTLKCSDAKWGYKKSGPSKELKRVQVWRVMPKDLLNANTERHRRVYRMKKVLKRQILP